MLIKTTNFEAGSVYAVMNGTREHYDTTPAAITDSLFMDYMLQNGLSVKNGKTYDLITLKFNYGTRSYEEERKRIEKMDMDSEKKQFFLDQCDKNKDLYDKKSADQIRTIFYNNGLDINWGKTTIHYVMLFRSAGYAKIGQCRFIREELYETAVNFLRMGIHLPEHDAPVVEIGAYSSLVGSSIVGRIQINPDDILVLKDVDSTMFTEAIAIDVNEQNQCVALHKHDYPVSNTLFDGQALIDYSIFPEWGNGYVLLRHHFFKAAAFKTNIQGFFQDYFGDSYRTATVTDMFGNKHLASNIKLITTNNALKFLKLGVTYDYWCNWVRDNGCMFGIVKTAHPSKLGDVQRMSYQMVNTLSMETMDAVMAPSINYIRQLKSDINVYCDYLRRTANFSNDHEVLLALYEQDHTFEQSEYFRQRKRDIIRGYVWNLKNGKLIQNGDNLVIVGSPYAMLLHSVGEDALQDPTFGVEDDAIQCYTGRFVRGEYLAAFRQPFNSQNNMNHMHNVYHPYFDKYFDLGSLVIAVNMIGTSFQNRNNGSDQDSDMLYTTNNGAVVAHARNCYLNYPTIVNEIPKSSNHYGNTPNDFAAVDNQLAKSQLAIGESSNLAQIALTYAATFPDDDRYADIVCCLAVLAQAAIDQAKRTFLVDISSEIKRLKMALDVKHNGYPQFWTVIREGFSPSKVNTALSCPMNQVYEMTIPDVRATTPTLPMSDFFVPYELNISKKLSRKVEDLIERYDLHIYDRTQDDDAYDYERDNLLLREDFDELVETIRGITLPNKYIGLMAWLINRAFIISPGMKATRSQMQSTLNRNKVALMRVLYEVNPQILLKIFAKNVTTYEN